MRDRTASLLDLLICRIPGLSGDERLKLADRFRNEEDFLRLSKNDVESLLGRQLGNTRVKFRRSGSWEMDSLRIQAEKDAEFCFKLGIHMVSLREETYPPLLRESFDPPVLLFYRGFLPDPERPLAAVVGTRKPSAAAASRAYELGRELGEAGISVVSGLALGIDSLAHRGNIDGKVPTVAVLGSSPDMIYPSSNRDLARRILETGGLILSEYLPGTGPRRWTFPARNRIISALARGLVLVEAPEKSGALISAQLAVDQGRDLWVDAVGISSPRGAGTARLAEEGAKVISSAEDILREWNMPVSGRIAGMETGAFGPKIQKKQKPGANLALSLAEYLEIKA